MEPAARQEHFSCANDRKGTRHRTKVLQTTGHAMPCNVFSTGRSYSEGSQTGIRSTGNGSWHQDRRCGSPMSAWCPSSSLLHCCCRGCGQGKNQLSVSTAGWTDDVLRINTYHRTKTAREADGQDQGQKDLSLKVAYLVFLCAMGRRLGSREKMG